MNRIDLFQFLLTALCFAVGAGLLAGQPGAGPSIVVVLLILSTRVARAFRRRPAGR